jgi:ribosomal protein L37E
MQEFIECPNCGNKVPNACHTQCDKCGFMQECSA